MATVPLKFARKTGNLPQSIVATAVKYDSEKEFDVKPDDGNRWSFVAYKITEKMKAKLKEGDTLPEKFAVQVPVLDLQSVLDTDKGIEFVDGLVRKYQDSILHDVADGESKVDPSDLTALIADYFDTSRARNAVTLKDVQEWLDEEFLPALSVRFMQINETEGVKKKTDEQMAMIAQAYEQHIRNLCGRSVDKMPSNNAQISIRQWVELLIDKELMTASDVSKHVVDRINTLQKTVVEVIEAAV